MRCPLGEHGVSFWTVASSLAWQRPQQATGGGEEVDGRRAVCDEGGLQPESLEHLHLQDTRVRRNVTTNIYFHMWF